MPIRSSAQRAARKDGSSPTAPRSSSLESVRTVVEVSARRSARVREKSPWGRPGKGALPMVGRAGGAAAK